MSNNTQRNKDLPAYPISFKTQFGQEVILAGLTKLEIVAMQIFNTRLKINEDLTYEEIDELLKNSFVTAERFCEYLEKNIEPENSLKLV
jgi:hypothetical protein